MTTDDDGTAPENNPDADTDAPDDGDDNRPADEAAAIAGHGDATDDDATGDGDDAGPAVPHIESPDDHAEGAFRRAIDAIETADPDDIIEEVKIEKDVVDDFASDVGAAIVHGLPKNHAKAYASKLKDRLDNYTKTDLVEHVDQTTAELRAAAPNAGRNTGNGASQQRAFVPLDHWVEDNLQRVVVLKTTDAQQETTYRWHFDTGVIETKANAEGVTHFAWNYYRDELYQGLGVNTAKPERKEAEEWRQWIATLIENRGEEKEVVGARSHAVEQLQRRVADAVGYTDLSDAAERGGVHVKTASGNSSGNTGGGGNNNSGSGDGDGDTDDATAGGGSGASGATPAPDGGPTTEEVRVLYPDIAQICEDAGIEVRALQSELDARGYVHPRVAGVSETSEANGGEVRYWVFTDDIGDPATVVDDPESPAAQAAFDGDPAASPISGGVTPGTSAGDDGAGHLGGIGPKADSDESDGSDATDATTDADDATNNASPDMTDDTTDTTDADDNHPTDGGDE